MLPTSANITHEGSLNNQISSGVAYMQEQTWTSPANRIISKLDIRIQGTSPVWRIATVQGDGLKTDLSLTVTGAAGSPIVITAVAHGFQVATSRRVTIAGVLGNTNANGTFVATYLAANTLTLTTLTGGTTTTNSAYISGGTVTYGGSFKFIELLAGAIYSVDNILSRAFTLYFTANTAASANVAISYWT